ncbi:MAG: thermonuclease family protein [Patescibacteria group bacterium]|nr:thermonuclease family protein [Patescibacteria group bacterium]
MTGATSSILAGIVLAGALAALAVSDPPRELIGNAAAVDGDTIRLGGARVRLWGIDAPESLQTCQDGLGHPWACGAAATATMRGMLARDSVVTCVARDRDRYGRLVALCKNGAGDLGLRMVALGMAIDWARYSHHFYRDAQDAAREVRAGIWAGTFEEPAQWRREHQPTGESK